MLRVRLLAVVLLAVLPPAASADGQTWVSFGPPGGEVRRMVVAPSDPSTVVVLPGRGGLFLTTTAATTWRSIAAGSCDVRVNDAAFHPTNPAIIYVATASAGVCRSTDAGLSWTALSAGLPVDANGYQLASDVIAVNPATPATLLAGTKIGVYRSVDGGLNWTAAGVANKRVRSIVVSPSTPATAYLLCDDGVFKSTDSGATWTAATSGVPAAAVEGLLSIDPSDANVVYLAAGTIYKTSNGGTLWSASNTGIGAAASVSRIVIDPTNTAVLYVSAVGGCGWCKSTNAGGSWSAIAVSTVPAGFGFSNAVLDPAIGPGTPNRFYAATAAGVFRSTDNGVTWTAANDNLAVREVTAPAPGGGSPASLLFASRGLDGAVEVLRVTGGTLPFSAVAAPFTGTDTGTIVGFAVDPSNAAIVFALGGNVGGQHCPLPYKTTNGGTTWVLASSGIPAGICGNAITMDATSPSTLYIATVNPSFNGSGCCETGVYKTTNGGTNWVASNAGIVQNSVNRIAISPQRPAVLYAAAGGQVYRSANSGGTWSSASGGLPPNTATNPGNVRRVAIDPADDNIVYAATRSGVFRTTNAGASWTAIRQGWPSLNGVFYSANALTVDPVTPTTIYASPSTPSPGPTAQIVTDDRGAGLMKSTDSGATWVSAGVEIAGAIVNDVVFDASRTPFATTNNGLFRFGATLPSMSIDRTSFAFSAVTDGTAFATTTGTQTVRLTQSGSGAVTWSAASTTPWLVVSPASGSGSATLQVSVQFAAGLVASQGGSITLSFSGAANSAGPITVVLTTIGSTVTAAPLGSFDTPLDGSTGVTGSIAVTGWAMDDIEVTRVRILRDPVGAEPVGVLVFLGDAVLVDGARPDVQAGFPALPRSSRAGWGYLMLTNFLPGLGNGTYRLHAIADDADGHSTLLGSKTITCANSAATTPFGAIDTPAQGETVAGTINNFGWVLSPGARRADPPSGGAVQVVIDGALGVAPDGWVGRPDLTSLFPAAQFSGIGSALGVAAIDTTALTNGVHTIAWLVTDNAGGTAGVGSRYFTVSNGSGVTQGGTADAAAHTSRNAGDRSSGAFRGRRGFDPYTPLQTYAPDAGGRITIQAEELDRIELVLGGDRSSLRPLPFGSRIDPATGVFTWHPGVAFLGAHDFVLGGRDVRIVLNPKGSGRVGPQTAIDIADGAVVAGWAADLDSQVDSGVDAIHVWAYPADGSDPTFAGAADYGGARPDVAAIFGQRFLKSGYGLRVTGLAPGTYDLAVFAYSTVQGRFVPAKVARVTITSR